MYFLISVVVVAAVCVMPIIKYFKLRSYMDLFVCGFFFTPGAAFITSVISFLSK